MSDHDFEKQVHQKLEELKLRPSDTVWMEVEKNIRQEKRRRRFMWLWLPMLFICLSTSAYILYRYTTPAAETSNITHKETTTLQPATAQTGQTGENITTNSLQSTDSKQPDLPSSSPAQIITHGSSLPNEKQTATVVTEKNNKEKTIGYSHEKIIRDQVAVDNYDPSVAIVMPGKHAHRVSGKKKVSPDITVQKEVAVQQEPVTGTVTSDVVSTPEQQDALTITMPVVANDDDKTIATNKAVTAPINSKAIQLMMPDSSNTTTAAAVPIQRKRPVLWHWGVVTNAGVSHIAESKLLELKELLGHQKKDERPLNTAGGSSLINVSTSSAARKASPIQPDLSFSAGVFVQRTLSPRLKLSLGLSYTYMSVNTQVGQKFNSPTVINTGASSAKTVPEYYKAPGYGSVSADATLQNNFNAVYQGSTYFSDRYRYRFQYIEMPLMVNWQINKGKRLPPIMFEGGVSISRLLSVDALHFEDVKGVYYADDDLFNKTQFNFVAGLSVGLLQKSKHPIWIGPNLRYAFNGMIKKEVSAGQYLWSTGITVKMLLGKL